MSNRQRGGAVQVVLNILSVLLLLLFLAALVGLWFLKHSGFGIDITRTGGTERVEIRHPLGEIAIEKTRDVADKLKLPVYPGAEAERDGVSVKMRGEMQDEAGELVVTAAQFYTRDDFERVDAWYRQRLGPEFERLEGRIVWEDPSGDADEWLIPKVEVGGHDTVYKVEKKDSYVRGVALRRQSWRVKIGLFDVRQSEGQ